MFRKKIGEKPEVGFLAVALICGTLLSFSEPKDYVSWDEKIHYRNAEKLADNFVVKMKTRPNTIETSYSVEEQKKIDVSVDSKYKEPKVKSTSIGLEYNKVAYVPSAIVIALGNILHIPFHITFILARWINLFVYSLIVYFAIRKLKSGKMIMSVVALFPTSIFLASNYGYDAWVIAFSMLGLAYLFSELQQPEKKMSFKDMIIMLVAFVIGLGPKAIYFPLLFLLFLLKKEKFESLQQYKKFIWGSVFAIVFVVGSFMLPFVVGGPGDGDRRGGEDVNSTEQVKFVLSQPVEYAKILSGFIVGYVNPKNADGFVSFFAYLGMTKTFWLVMLLLVAVVFTDKNEYDKKIYGWKSKTLIVAIYFATVALISTALYVSFTPVGSLSIAGVQPRYLIPLVFPLLFVWGGSFIKNSIDKNFYSAVVFAVMAFALLQGTWDLIIKFYY